MCLIAHLSAQNPGDLDLNYGIDGIGTISWAGKSTMLFSIARQSNDRVIVGGFKEDMISFEENVMAARLDETGALNNFGNNITHYMNNYDETESVTATYVLPDDKIIIAGYYGEGLPFVSLLHADGTLNSVFAGTGSYINESISFVPTCIDVYTTLVGYNIVMCGYSNDYNPYLLMLDQNGDAVSTFGSGGLYEFTGSGGMMKKLAE